MKTILAPAVALMNRLRYPYKFALIGVLALIAVAYLLITLSINLRAGVNLAQGELAGVRVVKPLLGFVQQAQQHRGLAAGVLGGEPTWEPKVAEKAKEVEAAIRAVDTAMAADGRAFGVAEHWQTIKGKWTELAKEWPELTGPASFLAHTELIGEVLALVSKVGDASSLVVDPALDSFYVVDVAVSRLPETLEYLARVRGSGTGILARKSATDDERFDYGGRVAVLEKMMARLQENLTRAGKYNADIKAELDRFLEKFTGASGDVLQIVQREIVTGRPVSEAGVFFAKATDAIDIGYGQLGTVLLPTAENLIAERMRRLEAQFYVSVGIALLAALAVAYLLAASYVAITGTIRELTAGTDRLASGDLAARIETEARDELRLVAERFNAMAASFSELIRSIQASAAKVSTSSAALARSAAQVSGGSEQQSEAASNMAAAIQQMTVSIDEISKNAETAQEVSERSGKLSAEGGNVVQETVREINGIAADVSASARIIERLGEQSDQITAIVKVIKDIADQTNLLALNAAIEAARAGESGRGFAVVADEVRKLAERTGNSTQEIAAMVAAIQKGTAEAVAAMHSGAGRVSGGVELAHRAGESMERIKEGASQVVHTINEISLALKEQGVASTDIARNVERIARMAEENSAAASAAAHTAQEMEHLAAELNSAMTRFRVA
ncbi:MAG: methyl-accepting chemotaxis protein [Pseudomonadota bacterium]